MWYQFHCKRWNNIFPWRFFQQKSPNHGAVTPTKNYVARRSVSLRWRNRSVPLVVPLRKVKLNKFLIDHIFEITLHSSNTHLNLKCGKCVNFSTILTWYLLYEAVSTIRKIGVNGYLMSRAIFKVMVASTSKFMSMHGLCYRWEGCSLLKWESYMHMDQVVIQKIIVNDHE